MPDHEALYEQLDQLRAEHRVLDLKIQYLTDTARLDQIRLQRLKKRRLALRDMIRKLESMLVPDIIA